MRYPASNRRQLAEVMALVVCLAVIVSAQNNRLSADGFNLGPTDSIYKSLVVQSILDASKNPAVEASLSYETTYRFSSPEMNSYIRSVALQKKHEQDEANGGSFFNRPWYYQEPKRPAPK